MRLAIFSDIHANCVALDVVLADIRARQVDQMVCLGDAIQGGPQPAETVARLRNLACPIVMGNADAFLLTGEITGAEPVTEQMAAVQAWSLARLTAEDRAFIGGFRPTITLDLSPDWRLLCFHGSPSSFDDIILPETPDDIAMLLLGLPQPERAQLLTGGHTHRQQLRRLGAALFFNPGSVGLPFRHPQPDPQSDAQPNAIVYVDPWAEYAIVTVEDAGQFGLEFRRVPYDMATLRHAYQAGGRPFAEDELARYA